MKINHIKGPEGVRGRNSDNTLIKKVLNWVPSISLEDGLRTVYFWLKGNLEKEKENGVDITKYNTSTIVKLNLEGEVEKK